jgi:penicillin-binding protein 1A
VSSNSRNIVGQNRKKPKPASFAKRITATAAKTILGVTMFGSAAFAGALVGLAISFRNLPDVRSLQGYVPSETAYIYDINGKLLMSLHDEENRDVVPLNRISPHLKRAVLAIEDSSFYQHRGINPIGIGRATLANFQAGRTVEGASTLTMQLIKNLFLTPEQAVSRKIAEAVLAMRLEQIFDKNQILDMYLNQVYWGHNTYGAETAARSYFNKSAADLTLAEAAMMAGIIQAPESYSPFISLEVAKKRQLTVLNRMLELNWITRAEYDAALQQKIVLGKITSFQRSASPYITDTVYQELVRRYGQETVIKGGMRVQSTLDLRLQTIAEAAVRRGHDRILASGIQADQMALVAVDPRTHFIKAIVGGVDYKASQFNRATQALRQPGSAFKPFVFYTAFATGNYTPDTPVNDTPVTYYDGPEPYRPQNYDRTFAGSMSIRSALASSRNIPPIVIGQRIGLNRVIEVCRTLGIKSPILPVISLPLGSVDLTPLEIVAAFATFANNGWQSETTSILQVTDNAGTVLLDNTPRPKLVLDPWSAASLNQAMQSVITSGTATTAQIGRPAAGKTGTTSSARDIWFVGYVPQLAAGVWAGNDDYSPIGSGASGGGFVAPVWADFMDEALRNTPAESFTSPSQFERPNPN